MGLDQIQSSKRAKVLIVFHRRESQAGAVGQWLRAHGYRLDIRVPAAGDPLPETLADHDGAIIFGGPMSANDGDDFIRTEIDWLQVPLREAKPFLGICLGAQMLAKHLGAEVYRHPQSHVEAGYCAIEASGSAKELMEWPGHVYQWHKEGFSLPSGAKRLAASEAFENQAMQYGDTAYGVQFHPEITLAMIHSWTTRAEHWLSGPGARPRGEHIDGHHRHAPTSRAWLDRFMRHWLSGTKNVRRQIGSPASNKRAADEMGPDRSVCKRIDRAPET